MEIHILTLFPEMVRAGLSESIIGRAAREGLLTINAVNIRDYSQDKHGKTDDYPYGGGAGLLMQAQPIYDAWQSVTGGHRVRTVYLTPQGTPFSQRLAEELAAEEELVLLCGHYEGIDERVLAETVTDYISIGDYVLTGGELPAMVLVDAIGRLVPGVLHNDSSAEIESFHGNLLEYPQYSRPEEWMGHRVPEVLLSGNREKIEAWRREESVQRTRERRPDLYQRYEKLMECRERLRAHKLLHMDMTELIDRGQAELVCVWGDSICLKDTATGIYFHTAADEASGRGIMERLRDEILDREGVWLVLHQESMAEAAAELLDLQIGMICQQAVYTKRRKLPIRGLYREEGQSRLLSGDMELPVIRPLLPEHIKTVVQHYDLISEKKLRARAGKGWLFGAFCGDVLAGFAGMHAEGGMGMLMVLPEYRRRGIAKALETYVINRSLELGFTPYGHVMEHNEASVRLQESLGLCFARGMIYWMKKS